MIQSVARSYHKILHTTYDERGGGRSLSTPSSPSPSPPTTALKRKSGEVCSGKNKPADCSCRPRVRKIQFRMDPEDSSPVVRDGHQWRKYGQKVTRDSPFPRAYFRCSSSPSCPVKKKVQRCRERMRRWWRRRTKESTTAAEMIALVTLSSEFLLPKTPRTLILMHYPMV